jgi:hypothetical protein
MGGRVWAALAAYAGLALAAYVLLEDERFRWLVWVVLGGLAAMTLARAKYGDTS